MRGPLVLAAAVLLLGATAALSVEITLDGKRVNLPVCGGYLGIKCGADEWCDYPDGIVCGRVDHFGTCRPRPKDCSKEYEPVCGCDGNTHGNVCMAAAAGSDVAYEGPCKTAP